MPPASIRVSRALEWIDTDAGGIWHYSTSLRYIEHAELELHRRLGILDQIIGHAPRVRIEIDFRLPVRFGDEVVTTLGVTRVGRSSITYGFTLEGPAGRVAEGSVVTVLTDDGGAREVPDDLRAALLERGDVSDIAAPSGPGHEVTA